MSVSLEQKRYRNLADAMGIAPFEDIEETKHALCRALAGLITAVGITKNLSTLGITEATLARLADFAGDAPCIVTNPIIPTRGEIQEIYARAF